MLHVYTLEIFDLEIALLSLYNSWASLPSVRPYLTTSHLAIGYILQYFIKKELHISKSILFHDSVTCLPYTLEIFALEIALLSLYTLELLGKHIYTLTSLTCNSSSNSEPD